MGIKSVLCHVRQGQVTVVTDLEGDVTRLICPDYESATGECRLRIDAMAGGPLSQLFNRLEEHTLETRATRCELLM
jgi:hypothetical protein